MSKGSWRRKVDRDENQVPIFPQIRRFVKGGEVHMWTYFPDKMLMENCPGGIKSAETSIRELLAGKISYDTLEMERDATFRAWSVNITKRLHHKGTERRGA